MAGKTQVQEPQPASSQKRRRISKRTWIVLICIAGIVVAVFWILVGTGHIPTVLGMSPAVQAIVLPIILGVVGLILGAISIVPNDEQVVSRPQEQPPVSPPININLNYPPYPPTPFPITQSPQPVTVPSSSPQSTDTTSPDKTPEDTPTATTPAKRPSGSLSYHQEPTVSTNPQTIQ